MTSKPACSLGIVTIALVYRPPSGDKGKCLLFLEVIKTVLCSTKLPLLVKGDINIDMIRDDVYAKEFCNVALTYGCSNQIALPTRLPADCLTALDVTLINISFDDLQP